MYKEINPRFHVIRDQIEKVGIRFQSEEEATYFKQAMKEILAEQALEEFFT